MKNSSFLKIEKLLNKGVKILNPNSIEIGEDVNTERISGDGVVIYTGCKIFGPNTLILQDAKLGYEGPVTIENCQIGPNVELKGGFYQEAVFLQNVITGSGSHVRAGTILEEEARVAHTVGLKQTILFPYVTLGSLINFCDCLMTGGTSRKDHSEVGRSYIHFNYTPNQDKAAPSLIGDVPNGVMLNQKPIFLGGQGGLVGPCRLAFGTTLAAGSIYRKDELRPGRLIFEGKAKSGSIPFKKGMYRNIKRIFINNIIYIANLIALLKWYQHVRLMFVSNVFPETLLKGLEEKLYLAIVERIKRLNDLSKNMLDSVKAYQKSVNKKKPSLLLDQENELYTKWPELEAAFKIMDQVEGELSLRDRFLEMINLGIKKEGKNYISVIKQLDKDAIYQGTSWLQGIVDNVCENIFKIIPSFSPGITREPIET